MMMAYENKGSMATTVTVSLYPDVSGNFVCSVDEAHDVTIQRGLDYVETVWGSGEVVVKPGNYGIQAKIEVPSYTVFRGVASPRYQTVTTRFSLANGVNDDVIGNKAGATKVEIRNFDVFGNSANQANGHGINIDATDSIVDGNYLNQIKENGINSTAVLAKITNNRFQNIDGNGINLTGSDSWIAFNDGTATGVGIYVNVGNTEIIGNHTFLCGTSGIQLDVSGDQCTVVGNRCNDNTQYGLFMSGQYCTVTANRCHDNTRSGILANGQDGTMAGNVCEGNGWAGIQFTNAGDRNSCVGNNCVGNGRHGIWLTDVADSTITGNTCMNNGQDGAFYGIFLDFGSVAVTNNVISSNICSDNQTGVETQQHGIYLEGNVNVTLNRIIGNICRGNQQYGVYVAAGALLNTVKDNNLTGNGTGAIQDLGTDTAVHWIFCRVTDPTSNLGNHPAVTLPDATDTYVYSQIPISLEFQELVTAQIIVVQSTGANPNMVWTCDTDWGKLCAGEDYLEDSDTTGATSAMAQDDLVCLDISAALDGIAAGDLIGVSFMRDGDNGADTINGPAYYLGIRVRYV